jgi:preprotein translocase subunit SecB
MTDAIEPEKGPEFAIQRIYVKDLSLESPNTPKIFLDKWEPELSLDIGTNTQALGDHSHEVVINLTVTVKMKDKVAFLVEVKQAGIFTLNNFPEEEIRPMLGAFCPNILYPYAREAVTDAVTRAGFPQLYLHPINFDAMYQQHEQEKEKEKAGDEGAVH